VRFIDGIAGLSEANVIGHSVISIGDIDQLSSDARKTCLPSQESYAARHFSIVSAASLEKIAHFHPLLLDRMGSYALRRQRNVQTSTSRSLVEKAPAASRRKRRFWRLRLPGRGR
jgi:hypothetical protein